MTDTTQTPAPAKREAVAIRDWIDAQGNPLATGDEGQTAGFRYIHLPSVKRLVPNWNAETDSAPAGTAFDCRVDQLPQAALYMLATFGGLTLAGNVVNSAVNGPKGDPTLNPIALIEERFAEIASGKWAERAAGTGGVRYDKEKLAQAIATAKGENDPSPYLGKMENKLDPKTGAVVPPDTKGAISYGAFALRNAKVKAAYDALTGGGVQLDTL